MKIDPEIMVAFLVESNRRDRMVGAIEVTGLPNEGVFVKPPRLEMPFYVINETKPFMHMGPCVHGQGAVYDCTVPPEIPMGANGLEVGGLLCWRVRPFDEDHLPVAPCLGQDLPCRFQLDSPSVYPFVADANNEAEDRQAGDYERRSADLLALTTPYPIELECNGAEGYGVLWLYSLDPKGSGTGLLRFVHSADWPPLPQAIRLFRFSRCIGSATPK